MNKENVPLYEFFDRCIDNGHNGHGYVPCADLFPKLTCEECPYRKIKSNKGSQHTKGYCQHDVLQIYYNESRQKNIKINLEFLETL